MQAAYSGRLINSKQNPMNRSNIDICISRFNRFIMMSSNVSKALMHK